MSSPIIGSSTESSGDENTMMMDKPQFKTVLEAAAAPRPRLCHLKKWPHFQGYGFNLHAEKSKLSQHIGKVDQGSPAESAGLREGDRIIEVNNVNISNENHQQVVKRIRNGLERDGAIHDDEVLLLVIDRDGEDYYRNMNVVIKSDFDNVIQLRTADPPPIQPAPAIQIDEKGEDQPVPSPRHKKISSPSLSSSSVSPRSDTQSPSKQPPQAPALPASTSSLVMSSSSLSSPSSTSSKTNTPNPNTTSSSSSSSKASTSKTNNNNINAANNNSIASSAASTVSINTPTTTSRANTKDNSIGSTLIQDPYSKFIFLVFFKQAIRVI